MAPDGAGHACQSAGGHEGRLERSADGGRRRGATGAGALARLCVLALAGWCTVARVGGQQVQTSPYMKPLLGGHLYWRVNKNFEKGGRERQVHFTLLTAFEANEDACIYSAGDRVMCGSDASKEKPPNGAADVHGVLCVKMIRHTDADVPQIITPNIRNPDGTMGACPYVHELQTWRLTQPEQELCLTEPDLVKNWVDRMPPVRCYANIHPAMTSVGGFAYRPANSSDAVLPIIGTENNFDVLSVHASDNVNEALRKTNGRKIVFGAKQHTVIVPEDVSGIVAYLAAPNGTVILAGQGRVIISAK